MTLHSRQDASKGALVAYTVPFLVFMLLLGSLELVGKFTAQSTSVWLNRPEFLIYPFQTIICGTLLAVFGRRIEFRGIAYPAVIFLVGFVVFAIWTSPQFFRWLPPRFDGFNPDVFAGLPVNYWITVSLRFLRLVIVVPLLEEIFYRGFLMRYLIREDFTKVPLGTYQHSAFIITTLAFALGHWGNHWLPGPDFAAAIITGAIYNGVVCVTRSLGSCVFAHAVTNLCLGLYIMQTKQWGFW